jgi:hypothetical protein
MPIEKLEPSITTAKTAMSRITPKLNTITAVVVLNSLIINFDSVIRNQIKNRGNEYQPNKLDAVIKSKLSG